MWSLISSHLTEPKSGLCLHKGGYHTNAFALRSINPLPEKKFNYIKNCEISKEVIQETMEPQRQPQNYKITNNNPNPKKKKKKRRRRRRKCKSNQEVVKQRQRQISVESQDSVVIFLNENSDFETETTDFGSSDSFILNKKVRFADDNQLCQVHPMVVWSFAYQAARKGPWEEYARDRGRFIKRISDVESTIGYIFNSEHRSKIYKERFADL